jgi:hypothetical protein
MGERRRGDHDSIEFAPFQGGFECLKTRANAKLVADFVPHISHHLDQTGDRGGRDMSDN